ncbi:serine hydrolase domain-containing protein [Belliella kenyensis]|uniref:Serine hydrolase domain-containing protein n=1 Tax=Belliella kenyensis TaxID=1472724 RepID=A0ABV8EP77_9BACT|nr:beta-lactamase family protein [Belliella kenyensis]MCH7402890.1 beta-lactamase family protein [Belliella kenyensis]MDN3602596.1 serine hydrolase domain-containing protein [Belliella kenyensis]
MRIIKLFIVFISTTFFSCQSGKDKRLDESYLKQVEAIIKSNNFNGVVLIADENEIVYHKAFGFSDLENNRSLAVSDQFYIGSISKQITAVLIVREIEKERLKLSDTISKFVSDIEQDWVDEVTVHHLLTHTHGIVELNEPLAFELGSEFSYSQIGYGLLASILEKIHGKSFERISTDFFKDLGLQSTFHPEHRSYKNLVKSYEESELGELVFSDENPVKYIAAGGFISNAADLLKWNKLLHSGEIINPTSLEMMQQRYATRVHPILDSIEYGYGLIFKENEEQIQIGAFGYAPGFASANYYYPQKKMHLIILSNVATQLDNFKKTFQTHTELMGLIKASTFD